LAQSYHQAKVEIEQLVERFATLSAHNRKGYNEPATRQDFIMPLFRALGWNTEDKREVSPEERVSRGYVDFAFRLHGIPRFFLETKRIPADLEKPQWAQQAINYAWLKGVTWAVLTDFEGLKVFNAEWQETIPARAVFKDLHWQQYLDRFDDLWLLSRLAMEEGALDRAAEAVGKKVKKTPVSRQLFADLTAWRGELFRHLRPYNPLWTVEQIDQAVQRILDRLIFIRTCEDREIEPYRLRPMLRQWRDQGRKQDLVKELNALFREFDATYDTRLFAPHLCEALTSEPTPFEQIIAGLYEVPGGYGLYDFNAIDADVLGTIYEQYLGHRAQDPEGKQVVDKRAKRKAQGIYYTPQFVVRYIVGQTLGRLLEERDYEQARQVKVLDMACGSGSFLIEAFDVLDRYLAQIRGQHTPLPRHAGERRGEGARAAGDMHDYARRMEILTGNLYGVDLDAQAVEIAQLNLLLKAVNQRGRLPELANVRQGNSLISGTPEELEAAFGPDWRDKHPFNWAEEFPQVFTPTPTLPLVGGGRGGGFDVIVGNPPYIRIQTLPKDDAAWYGDHYRAASGSYDIYVLFVERALELLRPGGVMGFILPNKFFQASYGEKLRALLSEHKVVWQVVDFEDAQVFEFSTTYTCLLFLRKETNPHLVYVAAGDWLKAQPDRPALLSDDLPKTQVAGERLSKEPWILMSSPKTALKDKIEAAGLQLGEIAERIFQGLKTSADKVYILEKAGEKSGRVSVRSGLQEKIYQLEPGLLKPLIKGGQMRRYLIEEPPRVILFPYAQGQLLSEGEISSRCPLTWQYLLDNKELLEKRERGRMRHEGWYGYIYPKNLTLFEQPKIVTPDIAASASFGYDAEGHYYFTGGGAGGYGILLEEGWSYLYVLGLLNSRLLDWYLQQVSSPFRGGYFSYEARFIRQLPIRRINFDDPADVACHDRMVALVEEVLRLQKEHAAAEAFKEDRRHDLARRIEQLDAQIDALVYELYGLTEEEIALIEKFPSPGGRGWGRGKRQSIEATSPPPGLPHQGGGTC
jgi:type I restriction-modification system DNA methylase subunit